MTTNIRICVGDEVGQIKDVVLTNGQLTSVTRWTEMDRSKAIVALAFEKTGKCVYAMTKDHTLTCYNAVNGTPLWVLPEALDGPCSGLYVFTDAKKKVIFASCTDTGKVLYRKVTGVESVEGDGSMKRPKVDVLTELQLATNVYRFRCNEENPNVFAVGGKESDLRVWDITSEKKEAIFLAKNVPHDNTDLRVPVWVTDMAFVPGSNSTRFVVGTGYGNIRYYDSTVQRRPVLTYTLSEHPIMSVRVEAEADGSCNFVVYSDSVGLVRKLELSTGRNLGAYKGPAGSVRDMKIDSATNTLVSCGADRFLRVHHYQSRATAVKVYLKQRMTCLALCEGLAPKTSTPAAADSTLGSETGVSDEKLPKKNATKREAQDIWQTMEPAEKTQTLKKKKVAKA